MGTRQGTHHRTKKSGNPADFVYPDSSRLQRLGMFTGGRSAKVHVKRSFSSSDAKVTTDDKGATATQTINVTVQNPGVALPPTANPCRRI